MPKVNGRWKFTEKDFKLTPMTLILMFKTKAEARAWVKENARRRAAGLTNAGHIDVYDIGPFTMKKRSGKVDRSYCIHP